MALFIPPVEHLPADFWADRAGQPIVAIVLHGTGGTDSRNTLQHGDGRGVSIHKLIAKSGTIYAMVPDERGANHAGAPTSAFTLHGHTYRGGAVNRATLGIELENLQDGRDPYTDLQLSAMGWQIAEWRKLHGPLPILRHADLDPTRKRDPYQLSTQEIERWAAMYMMPATHVYRAITCAPVFQDRRPDAPLALTIAAGVEELVDDVTNGWVHLSSGAGFSPLSCWKRV